DGIKYWKVKFIRVSREGAGTVSGGWVLQDGCDVCWGFIGSRGLLCVVISCISFRCIQYGFIVESKTRRGRRCLETPKAASYLHLVELDCRHRLARAIVLLTCLTPTFMVGAGGTCTD
ncbi:unnamed protein product, partial [Pylaiella littoralis]